jgi:hypothetical protein
MATDPFVPPRPPRPPGPPAPSGSREPDGHPRASPVSRTATPTVALPEPDEVHVWTIPCAGSSAEADELLALLSERERLRSTRMADEEARSGFVIGRARLRQVLGAYLCQSPGALDLATRTDGRPVLAGAPPGFDFSFSRCARLHVCAIGVNRRIGIDVEVVAASADGERANALAMLRVKASAFAKVGEPSAESRWSLRTFSPAVPGVEAGTVVGAIVSEHGWRLTLLPWPGS